MLGSLILYLKGMRTTMFQLSGFYCNMPLESLYKSPYIMTHTHAGRSQAASAQIGTAGINRRKF